MELIRHIQSHLETVYNIHTGEAAVDYLIGAGEVSELLQVKDVSGLPRELFLVNPNPQDDTLEIALFFHDTLKENLKLNSPLKNLNGENVSDFCTLIEGVSHFVYYLHKMGLEHNVSQLEMELQAEVDKFVLLSLFCQAQGQERTRLMELLFEDYCLHQELSSEQITRYETATEFAKKFCYRLTQNSANQEIKPFLDEARIFYSLPQEEKIRMITGSHV